MKKKSDEKIQLPIYPNSFQTIKNFSSDDLKKEPIIPRKRPSQNSEYKCTFCGKNYSTKGNLNNHLSSIHLNNKPFKCQFPNCNKSYINQSSLNLHYRSHTGIRPFICKICGKNFIEKGNLRIHLNSHSNDKPFKCQFCEKSYKIKSHLIEHINISHLKLKKFKCNLCNSSFGRKSTLNSHMKTHTGEKNFFCPIIGCEKSFSEKGNMKIHFKRHLNKINKKIMKNVINNKNDLNLSTRDNTKDLENINSIDNKNNLLNINSLIFLNSQFKDKIINQNFINDLNNEFYSFHFFNNKNFNLNNFGNSISEAIFSNYNII